MKMLTALTLLAAVAPSATANIAGQIDFADGAIVSSNPSWLSAQSNEPAPFNAVHTAPATFSWTHNLVSGVPSILTIALWDLDASLGVTRVSSLTFDGVAAPRSVFDTLTPSNSVKYYDLLVDQSFLLDQSLTVQLTLGPSAGNEVGIDFARLVPAPTSSVADGGHSAILLALGMLGLIQAARLRGVHVKNCLS